MSGPGLGVALLALSLAVSLVRHRAGLGLLLGGCVVAWLIRWGLVAPVEGLGPLLVQVDGVGLTWAIGAATGCALATGRGRAGLAACAVGAGLLLDARWGLTLLGVAWFGAAWMHAPPRRVVIGGSLVCLGVMALWWLGVGRLTDLPPMRSVVQLRVLAGYGVLLVPVLCLPGAARSAGLLAWTFGWLRFMTPICPEAVQIIGPGLRWLAVALAALGVVLMWRGRRVAPIALVAVGGALLAGLTQTALGQSSAALLLASGGIGLALAHREARMSGGLALVSPAWLAGLIGATHAGLTAVRSVDLGPWMLTVDGAALLCLIGLVFAPRAPLPRRQVLVLGLGILTLLGAPSLLGHTLPGAEQVAARTDRRALPPDDRFGWRRVESLRRYRPEPPPPDAGVE